MTRAHLLPTADGLYSTVIYTAPQTVSGRRLVHNIFIIVYKQSAHIRQRDWHSSAVVYIYRLLSDNFLTQLPGRCKPTISPRLRADSRIRRLVNEYIRCSTTNGLFAIAIPVHQIEEQADMLSISSSRLVFLLCECRVRM